MSRRPATAHTWDGLRGLDDPVPRFLSGGFQIDGEQKAVCQGKCAVIGAQAGGRDFDRTGERHAKFNMKRPHQTKHDYSID